MTERQRRWGLAGLFLLALVVVLLIVLSPWDAPQPAPPEHNTAQTNGPAPLPPDPQPAPPEDDPPAEDPQPTPPPDDETPLSSQPQAAEDPRSIIIDLEVPDYGFADIVGFRPVEIRRRPEMLYGQQVQYSFEGEGLSDSWPTPRPNLMDAVHEDGVWIFRDAFRLWLSSEMKGDYALMVFAVLEPLDASGSRLDGVAVMVAAAKQVSAATLRESNGRVRLRPNEPASASRLQLPVWARNVHTTLSLTFPAFLRSFSPDRLREVAPLAWPEQAGPPFEDHGQRVRQTSLQSSVLELTSDSQGAVNLFGVPAGLALGAVPVTDGQPLYLENSLWDNVFALRFPLPGPYLVVSGMDQLNFHDGLPIDVPEIHVTATPALAPEQLSGLTIHCVATSTYNGVATIRYDSSRAVWRWEFNYQGGVAVQDPRDLAGADVTFIVVSAEFDLVKVSGSLTGGVTISIPLTLSTGTHGFEVMLAESGGLPLPLTCSYRFSLEVPTSRRGVKQSIGPPVVHGVVLEQGGTFTRVGYTIPPQTATARLDAIRLRTVLMTVLREHYQYDLPDCANLLNVESVSTPDGRTEHDEPQNPHLIRRVLRLTVTVKVVMPRSADDAGDIRFERDEFGMQMQPTAATQDRTTTFEGSLEEFIAKYGLYDAYIGTLG